MDRPNVTIASAGHDVADARLHRHTEALAERGLTVELLGLGDAANAPAEAVAVTAVARPGMVGRALLALRVVARAKGLVMVAPDPDVLVAATLPGMRRGRLIVADIHEDYGALLRDRAWARGLKGVVARAVVASANRAARKADLVVVADDHLLSDMPGRIVVRNVPNRPQVRDRDLVPRAVYVGDVRASRGVFAMLDAIASAPGWSLDIVGPVAGADREAVAARVADLGGRVRLHDRQPPHVAWDIAGGAWVGFALLADTAAFRDATPSKLYEYLAHGMPFIATALPGHIRLAQESQAGIIVDDAEQAAAALTQLSSGATALPALANSAVEYAATSDRYQHGSADLAEAIENLLRSS